MKMMTKKDRFIRTLKLIRDFGGVCALFYALMLMFCDYEKVVAAIFSSNTIGITALIIGLIVGFAIGVYVTYKVFEADEITERQNHQSKQRKKQHKANHTKAPKAQKQHPNAVQPQTSQPQIIIIEKMDDDKVNSIFSLLSELDPKKVPAVQSPEAEIENVTLQEEETSVEES